MEAAPWSLARYLAFDEIRGLAGAQAILAEAIATFALVFLAIGTVIASGVVLGGDMDPARQLAIALAFGVSITLLVAVFGPISGGHINPAVTFGMMLTRKMNGAKGIAYILAQVAGATAAAYVLKALTPDSLEFGLGANGVSEDMRALGFGAAAGLGLEIVLTFFLVWTIFAVAINRTGPWFAIAPIVIGLIVLVDHLVGIPFTGTSINPARSFGPALAAWTWDDHWIFWLGPLLGGGLASVLYELIYGTRAPTVEESTTGEGR